jgi:hypothetical protein
MQAQPLRVREPQAKEAAWAKALSALALLGGLALAIGMPRWTYGGLLVAFVALHLVRARRRATRVVWSLVAAAYLTQASMVWPTIFDWTARFAGLSILVSLFVVLLGSQVDDM